MKKNYEIIIYGRGGQGAKTCAQIIAEGGMYSGNKIQGFPEYGPERRGAPVRSFVRISNKPIRIHEPVTNPDCVIVIDSKLFDIKEELKNFNCPYIINSAEDPKIYKNKIKSKKVYLVNGSKIAREEIKINNPNIVLIGSLLKLLKKEKKEKLINYKKVEETIKNTFIKKGKEHLVKPNINCLKKGFDSI
jgi:pyruvate ferredoxin oxidoreductase gamma subunit